MHTHTAHARAQAVALLLATVLHSDNSALLPRAVGWLRSHPFAKGRQAPPAEGKRPLVALHKLQKRYLPSGFLAVRDASFVVEGGECLSLLGPNGCGKTTTISCLTGELLPTGGTCDVRGADGRKRPAAQCFCFCWCCLYN